MARADRIDPAILVGKPVIKCTRLAVKFLLDLMAEGWPAEQILRNYPQLTADDLQTCSPPLRCRLAEAGASLPAGGLTWPECSPTKTPRWT